MNNNNNSITCCSTDYNFIMKDLASVLWCSRVHWSAVLPPRNPTWWCCCWERSGKRVMVLSCPLKCCSAPSKPYLVMLLLNFFFWTNMWWLMILLPLVHAEWHLLWQSNLSLLLLQFNIHVYIMLPTLFQHSYTTLHCYNHKSQIFIAATCRSSSLVV